MILGSVGLLHLVDLEIQNYESYVSVGLIRLRGLPDLPEQDWSSWKVLPDLCGQDFDPAQKN